MNKNELIAQISTACGESKTVVKKVMDGFMDEVMHAVKNGDKVALIGFGTFIRYTRKQTTGTDPRTSQSITIPAKNVPKFKPGKQFSDLVSS